MAKYGEIEYRYDASGIRQEKQVGKILHKYYTDGSRIYKEERGNEVLWYYYDNIGVTGLEHNGINIISRKTSTRWFPHAS